MIETLQFGNFVWSHIVNPTEKNFEFLINTYNFHPLDIEDCRGRVQRPKIDVYDDYYFIILHFPYFNGTNGVIATKEVKIFWGKDYIITIRDSEWYVKKFFDKVKEDVDGYKKKLSAVTTDAMLYLLLETLMKETLVLLDSIGREVEKINTDLFTRKRNKIIENISVTRKNIILLDTMFKPQLRLFSKFESGDVKGFAEDMEEYWGNILDYYQKMWDMTEDYEELIEGLSKTYDSLQTNRINEIIKVLTLISTILLPITFVASLYGMNVDLPLRNNPLAFWILVGSMIAIIIAFFIYFRHKRWM